MNKDTIDNIAHVLERHTINDKITWVYDETNMFDSESCKHMRTNIDNQEFKLFFNIIDGHLDYGSIVIYHNELKGEFMLSSRTASIDSLSTLVFDKYIKGNIDNNKDSNILNGILSKIGKDIIREKRLSAILDRPNKDIEVNDTILSRIKKKIWYLPKQK